MPNNAAVITQIVEQGSGPSRPKGAEYTGLTDAWWNICLSCWVKDVSQRPTIESLWGQLYATSHVPYSSYKVKSAILSLALLADGNGIAVGCTNGRVAIVDTIKFLAPLPLAHTGRVLAVAVSPNGKCLLTSGDDKIVRLCGLDPWIACGSEPMQSTVTCLTFSNCGNYIALGTFDGTVHIWYSGDGWKELRAGGQYYDVCAPARHDSCVEIVCFVPGINMLVSASSTCTIIFWDLTTPDRAQTGWYSPAVLGCCIEFSRDGGLLATGTSHGSVHVFAMGEGKGHWPELMPQHMGRVLALAFAPSGNYSGNYLASASVDMTVRVWDLRTFALVGGLLGGHSAPVTCLEFSPDGTKLASGSQDGTMRLWHMSHLVITGQTDTPSAASPTLSDKKKDPSFLHVLKGLFDR